MRWIATILTGFVLVAALAACGGGDQASGRDEATSSEKSSPSASADEESAESSDSTSDGEEPGEEEGVKTLTGKLSDGVEKNCLMLDADGEKYQLIGDKTRSLKAGMKVEVTGQVSEKAMTTCMEGTVFEVETVKTL